MEGDGGGGHEGVEKLVGWAEAHYDDVGLDVRVGGREGVDGLVVDLRGVRVVDGAVACDDELGGRGGGVGGHVFAAEGGVGG